MTGIYLVSKPAGVFKVVDMSAPAGTQLGSTNLPYGVPVLLTGLHDVRNDYAWCLLPDGTVGITEVDAVLPIGKFV